MAGMPFPPKSTGSSLSQRRSARLLNTYTPIEARSLLGCLGFSCHSMTRSASSMARMPMRLAADGDGDVGAVPAMRLHERLVVHLVDVVAGEDDDRVGVRALDDVHV